MILIQSWTNDYILQTQTEYVYKQKSFGKSIFYPILLCSYCWKHMYSLNEKQLEVEKTFFYKGALFIVINKTLVY